MELTVCFCLLTEHQDDAKSVTSSQPQKEEIPPLPNQEEKESVSLDDSSSLDQEIKRSFSPYPRRKGDLNRTRSTSHHSEEKERASSKRVSSHRHKERNYSTKNKSSPFCQKAKWHPSNECLYQCQKKNNQTRVHKACSKHTKDVGKETNTSSSGREQQNCSRSASPVLKERGRKRCHHYKSHKDKSHQLRWSSECESMSPLYCRKERDGCSGDKSHKDKEKCHHNRTASCVCDRTLACYPKDKGDSHSDGMSSCQQKQKQKVHLRRSEGSLSFRQEGYSTNRLYRRMDQVRTKESEISWIMISELKNENAQLKAELDDRNKASENLCLMYLRMKEKKDQALKELQYLQEHNKQIELRNSCLVDENSGLRKQLQKLKGASEPTDHIQREEGETYTDRNRPETPIASTSRGTSKKYSKMKHRNKSSPPEADSKMASGDACQASSSSLPTVSTSLEDARPSEPPRILSVPDTRPAL